MYLKKYNNSTNGAEIIHMKKKKKKQTKIQKKNLGPYLTLYVKINSKWILDLYVNLLRKC